MASLLIKNLPKTLHQKIRELALQHHRSMNKETIVLLEEAVTGAYQVGEFGQVFKGGFNLTQSFIDKAKRQGRA